MAKTNVQRPFLVEAFWSALVAEAEVRPADVLRRADLPEDLFARHRLGLDAELYVRLWNVASEMLCVAAPGLTFSKAEFSDSPVRLAALCSRDLTAAVRRFAAYNALTKPIEIEVHDTLGGLEVTFQTVGADLPSDIVIGEMVTLVAIARLGLRDEVKPIAVELKSPASHHDYQAYFGRTVRSGPFNRVVFAAEIARRPFMPPAPSLFDSFEDNLRARLDELSSSATMVERSTALLMEILPAGQADVALVGKRLGLSARSLQRRLRAEGTSFKEVLQNTRTKLAGHYLEKTQLSNAQMAFLLAYDDPNSFIRAFREWTSTTPEAMRRTLMTG